MKNSRIIKLTVKWTIIIIASLILWVSVFPILISANSYILPIIGLCLISLWLVTFIILIINQIKAIKQTNNNFNNK